MCAYVVIDISFTCISGRRGDRELAPWQTIAVGAVSGAMAAILTTPGDVMKTRIMTAPPDKVVNAGSIFVNIVQQEGVGALFKGCIPRMVWTAPQGAMNFAGYELAKRALTAPQSSPTTAPSEQEVAVNVQPAVELLQQPRSPESP